MRWLPPLNSAEIAADIAVNLRQFIFESDQSFS